MSITTTPAGSTAEIWIDIPPVNALALSDWLELAAQVRALGSRDDVHAILLAAKGRGFCAGVDIKELAADSSLIVAVNRACYEAFEAVYAAPVPVIAAVNGFCLGGGLGLVGSADLVVAADDAYFGLPEIDRGALGGATYAVRLFGMHAARRMLYTGEPIDAANAYRLGNLESVVPAGDLPDAARALASQIASKSPTAIRLAKESLNAIEAVDVPASYRLEQGFTLELYSSPDSHEARQAFVERRDGKFGPAE
jgi:enoyl-CoA hydratase